MSQDHFSANLDDDQMHDDRTIDVGEQHQAEHEQHETEPTPKSKRRIPASVWIIGVVVLFMAGGVGYKKLTHQSASNSPTAQVSELPPDNGGGMMPSAPQQPANVSVPPLPPEPLPDARTTGTQSVTPQQPVTAAQADSLTPLPSTLAPTAVAALAASVGSTGQVASLTDATPAPHASEQNSAASASVPAAAPILLASAAAAAQPASEPDAKDKEIARLRKQLRELKAGGRGTHTVRSTAKTHSQHVDTADPTDADSSVASTVPVKAAKRVSKRHNRIEVQLGYHIKQVIPGQGWVEDESSGKQIVVAIGDKIGGAEVTKIDADASKIYTTAGVIQ